LLNFQSFYEKANSRNTNMFGSSTKKSTVSIIEEIKNIKEDELR